MAGDSDSRPPAAEEPPPDGYGPTRSPFRAARRDPLHERVVPVSARIREYRPSTARRDLVAGLTVAALALPSGMAYAEVAGVSPVNGLYALLLPAVLYTFLGYGYDADDWLLTPFHSAFNGPKYFGYTDRDLDGLLDAQASEMGPEKRIEVAKRAARHVACQAYAIAAPPRLYFLGINSRVKNYVYHDSFDNGYPLTRAWLEK